MDRVKLTVHVRSATARQRIIFAFYSPRRPSLHASASRAALAPSARVPARLTLKREATKPAVDNMLQQQARFDAFIARYNQERPHAALGMKVPADLYTPSPRVYRGLADLTYPFHDATITVTHCGRICFQGRKVNLSHAFAGQNVGVTQVGDRVWLVSFMQYDLGYFDDEASGSNRSTIRSVPKCYRCLRNELSPMCPEWTLGKWSGRLDSNQRPLRPSSTRGPVRRGGTARSPNCDLNRIR